MPDSEHYHVLLMRHASHKACATDPDRRVLTKKGRKETESVASYLSGFLKEAEGRADLDLKVRTILYADSGEASETAKLLLEKVWDGKKGMLRPCKLLNPETTSPYGTVDSLDRAVRVVTRSALGRSSFNTIVIVGHQPLLGWISEILTGTAYPMMRSEILCLSFPKPGQTDRVWKAIRAKYRRPLGKGALQWGLAPSDDDTLAELTEKIRSKMEGAKLLGAFIIAMLGFLLTTFTDENKFPEETEFQVGLYISAAFFFLAVACYFATYFAYDRLLMPRRFWSERARKKGSRHPSWLVMRPPGSAQWVLYQNMMHVWKCLFIPATGLVYLGLIALAYGVIEPTWPYSGCLGVVIVLATVLAWLLYRSFLGPRIGSED